MPRFHLLTNQNNIADILKFQLTIICNFLENFKMYKKGGKNTSINLFKKSLT